MVERVNDDFEDQTFNAWTGTDGDSTVDSNNPYADSYAAHFNIAQSVNNNWEGCYLGISDNPCYVRAYLDFEDPPNTNNEDQWGLSFLDDAAGNALAYAGVRNDAGTLKWAIWYRDSGSFTYTVGGNFPADGYHCLELGILRNTSSAGWVELWVDGSSEIQETGVDHSRNLDFARVGFGYSDARTDRSSDLYADEAVVSTAYIGPIAGGVTVPPLAHQYYSHIQKKVIGG